MSEKAQRLIKGMCIELDLLHSAKQNKWSNEHGED